MGLPSSGIISGSQISAEVGTASTNISLGGLVDSASVGGAFGDKYSDFYGYANLTSYQGSSFQNGTKFICNQTTNVTFYHDGSNANPGVGDTVYTNSGGTTPGVGYSKVGLGYILTNSSGVMTNQYLCFT